MKPPLKIWLINPFEYISVTKALVIGSFIIILSGILNSFSNSHFDGVIDFHTGTKENYTIIYHILEGFIDVIVFSVLLYISALITSGSKIRFIDVLGMQSYARTPFILASIIPLVYSMKTIFAYFEATRNGTTLPEVSYFDWFLFGLNSIISIGLIVWIVARMWKAYAVSCNTKGTKAIVSFILSFIAAEIIIKITLSSISEYFIK